MAKDGKTRQADLRERRKKDTKAWAALLKARADEARRKRKEAEEK